MSAKFPDCVSRNVTKRAAGEGHEVWRVAVDSCRQLITDGTVDVAAGAATDK